MSVVEYENRTVDLVAYSGGKAAGRVELAQTLALPGQSGAVCTGIQKLAQRFFLELFTEQGSMLYQPARGCLFMTEARFGNFLTPADVLGAFSRAMLDVGRNLQAEDGLTTFADEQFQSATLLNVVMSPGAVAITVYLLSMAGTARTYIAPVPFTI